jgi:hypothetical protein
MTESTAVTGDDTSPATQGRHSRRVFLAGAGAGVASAAVVGAGTLPASATAAGAAVAEVEGVVEPGTIVAYLRDAAGSEISLLKGDHEVVVNDRALARALAHRFDQGIARATKQES